MSSSEYRKDRLTGQYVIVAKERTGRPKQTSKPKPRTPNPLCPLCEGNEELTPPEVLAYRDGGTANSPGWTLRVVSNKFPAVRPCGDAISTDDPFFAALPGHGHHEVVVETRRHVRPVHTMSSTEVGMIFSAVQSRVIALQQQPGIRYAQAFKNEGERAGASMDHPHSQILATSIVPPDIRLEYDRANRHREETGRCLHVSLVDAELGVGKRIIAQTAHFVTFCPFASAAPLETWVAARRGVHSFEQLPSEDVKEFGGAVRDALARLASSLESISPDEPQLAYNLVLRIPPVGWGDAVCSCWYARLVPRLTTLAGYEIATGVWINPMPPEDGAELLRGIALG
jgi:UDPglucose--hexose-1-phosphate uridylyltransferase